jgi:hypothetical protein
MCLQHISNNILLQIVDKQEPTLDTAGSGATRLVSKERVVSNARSSWRPSRLARILIPLSDAVTASSDPSLLNLSRGLACHKEDNAHMSHLLNNPALPIDLSTGTFHHFLNMVIDDQSNKRTCILAHNYRGDSYATVMMSRHPTHDFLHQSHPSGIVPSILKKQVINT